MKGNSKSPSGNSLSPLRAQKKDLVAVSQTSLTEVKLRLQRRLLEILTFLLLGNWEAVDSRSEDKHLHYFINVCRSVNINSSNELVKCPGGAIGACQIDHLSGKGFNLGYVQSDPQITDNGDLTLLYSGGSECHHQYNRSIRIVFSCSNTTVRLI